MCSSNNRPSEVGWGGWLDTPEGKAFEELGDRVYSFIESRKYLADGENRRFIRNKMPLSLDDVTKHIATELNVPHAEALEQVLLWLYEVGDEADPDYEGTQEHVDLLQQWVDDECIRRRIELRMY